MGASLDMASVPRNERAAARQSAYRRGLALPPASPGAAPGFPVADAAHWDKARRAVGRVKDPARRAALARLLRKTAPRFGKEKALRQSWAAPGGSSHANDAAAIGLAVRARDAQGFMLTCPECGHVAPAGDFGASGTALSRQPGVLRTPAPGTGMVRNGAAVTVRGGNAAHALANTRGGVELAAGTLTARRYPISGPMDVLVARGSDGKAVLRHRHGGAEIAQLRKDGNGQWVATVNGQDLQPRDHQRTSLMEAVGVWNKAVTGAAQRQEAPLQPQPQQTALMAEYGIPAMRAATFATPAASAAAGPRMTAAAAGSGSLGPAGQAVYRKLCAQGMGKARAMTLARHADALKRAA